MKLNEARELAYKLMYIHGILDKGWQFEFDNAKSRFGSCQYMRRKITLSSRLTEINEEKDVKDTILHEIAHALCPGQKHNRIWKAKAIEIGCNGNRCYNSDMVNTVQGKYVATCVGCNKAYSKHRQVRRSYSCKDCSGGKYNPDYKLVWEKVTSEMVS